MGDTPPLPPSHLAQVRQWSMLCGPPSLPLLPSSPLSHLAQVRQWSMLWGKLCTVHMGACFSGGSREAP